MNNEEQIMVLQMVADGVVSIEDGENLLDALESTTTAYTKPTHDEKGTNSNNNNKKWLRYQVIDEKSGVQSVNLRLPCKLFFGWFAQKGRFADNTSNEFGNEKQTKDLGMILNILGENDGKRFKLYFE